MSVVEESSPPQAIVGVAESNPSMVLCLRWLVVVVLGGTWNERAQEGSPERY